LQAVSLKFSKSISKREKLMTRRWINTLVVTLAAAGLASAQESVFDGPVNTVEFTPMTRSEGLSHYLGQTFGAGSFAQSAMSAGFAQLNQKPKEWGDGGEGYAKRLGNAYAKHFIRQTLQYGAATALHEDDRYLVSGQTGFWNRTRYAIASTFLARKVNGQRTIAFARFGSAAGAAFIVNTWQPARTSGADHAARSFGISIATNLGSNIAREFWPDLKSRFRRK